MKVQTASSPLFFNPQYIPFMKKNITINLFGTLYAIDEDACQLLEQYLDNMKSYFSRREGGDEIADDIEHRVAEIFSDLKAQGTEAISMENVQDIIRRIGNPEQMDSDADMASHDDSADAGCSGSAGAQQPPEPPRSPNGGQTNGREKKNRKLFRDPDDVMLGGVMSGLCKYFGATDALPWRILMVLLALLSFTTMGILYVIAWAIIPQARTTEERLEMQGKPVNPQTINEELMRAADKTSQFFQSSRIGENARGCLSTMMRVGVTFMKFVLLFVVVILIFATLFFGGVLATASFCSSPDAVFPGGVDHEFLEILRSSHVLAVELWGTFLFALMALVLILYVLLRGLFRSRTPQPVHPVRVTTFAVLIISSLAACITLGCMGIVQTEHLQDEMTIRRDTKDGYYLRKYQRKQMVEEGWKVNTYGNCNSNGYCFESEKSWNDSDDDYDDSVLHFERTDMEKPINVDLTHIENLAPGNYRLRVVGRSRGYGAWVYAKIPRQDQASASVPAKASQENILAVEIPNKWECGNLADLSREELIERGLLSSAVSLHDFNDEIKERMEDWSYADSEVFHHDGGLITMGITSIPSVVHQSQMDMTTSEFSVRKVYFIPADSVTAKKNK